MEEDVDDVRDWLETIETLVDARVMIIARYFRVGLFKIMFVTK